MFNLEDSAGVQYQQCCFWLAFLQARIPPTEPLGNIYVSLFTLSLSANEISAQVFLLENVGPLTSHGL
jgi:hypothetical protein